MCRWVDALEHRSQSDPWWVKADPRTHIGSGRHREHVIDSGFQWAEWLARRNPRGTESADSSSPTADRHGVLRPDAPKGRPDHSISYRMTLRS